MKGERRGGGGVTLCVEEVVCVFVYANELFRSVDGQTGLLDATVTITESMTGKELIRKGARRRRRQGEVC